MIFVGGTGRSGTTILAKILGRHSQIAALPSELRLITDPDGLLSLKSALVDNWSFFQADLAIDRFIQFANTLMKRYRGNYPNTKLGYTVKKEFFENWINEFTREFITFKFKGNWAARATVFKKLILNLFGMNRFTSKFFEDCYYCPPVAPDRFQNIVEQYFTTLFLHIAGNFGKNVIVDHTPYNILHASAIKNLFPASKILMIYRDPMDVIASYKKMDWADNSIKNNAAWVFDVLKKWEIEKSKLRPNDFLEIRFEDLIYDLNKTLLIIFNFLELPFENKILDIDLSNHHIGRYKSELSDDELQFIHNNFSQYLNIYRTD